MFSECKFPLVVKQCIEWLIEADASKFLAQSQSRISFAPNDRSKAAESNRRSGQQGAWRPSAASRLNRSALRNPYQPPSSSQAPGFLFSSRSANTQAPLFYSATDEFRENNDEEEHEKELADYYALQKSRRQIGGRDLDESSELDDEGSRSLDGSDPGFSQSNVHHFTRRGGIRSSWRGDPVASRHGQSRDRDKRGDHQRREKLGLSRAENADALTESRDQRRSRMVDVGLEDSSRSEWDGDQEDDDDDPPQDYMDNPPSIQRFNKRPPERASVFDTDPPHLINETTDRSALLDHDPSPPRAATGQDVPALMSPATATESPHHDAFWGHLYLLCLAATFATWFLVLLHTEAPSKTRQLGDTAYTALHASFYLLAIYTLVSTFVSLLWLAALRSYVRPVVLTILVGLPAILYSFSFYSFVSSFKGSWNGSSLQDTMMRWTAVVPGIMATLWILCVLRARKSLHSAVAILEFAIRTLSANPALLVQGFAVLAAIVSWTWLWLSMFTRVFLAGHLSTRSAVGRFIIDASTWWLAVYFILMYLWTVGMIFGIQRSVTSATVSQWYFHRLANPSLTSLTVVQAATTHALTTLFGTIALSTGLSLLIRLPLLILPRRLSALLAAAFYSFIPAPVVSLINPLTLTYASIHSQPLSSSARGLLRLHSLGSDVTGQAATTTLYPNTFSKGSERSLHRGYGEQQQQQQQQSSLFSPSSSLQPYRLSKLLLHATRLIMSIALGFGGWVHTSRVTALAPSSAAAAAASFSHSKTIKGSLYAYLVGLVAGAIGWAVLGSIEGVVAGVVDALVVCWGSEQQGGGHGRGNREDIAQYCREAGIVFGGFGRKGGLNADDDGNDDEEAAAAEGRRGR